MTTRFTETVLKIIKSIPEGRVMTYGRVAALAGNPRGARQVARILHSMTKKHNLPWHRIINSQGRISVFPHCGFEVQKALLESEGIEFFTDGSCDLSTYMWDYENKYSYPDSGWL